MLGKHGTSAGMCLVSLDTCRQVLGKPGRQVIGKPSNNAGRCLVNQAVRCLANITKTQAVLNQAGSRLVSPASMQAGAW